MKKMLTNNIGLKIASVFIAALLWLIVVNVDDPVKTYKYSASIEIKNEDTIKQDGMMYEIGESAKHVMVHVKAKRSILKELNSSDFEVTADLNELTSEYKGVVINVRATRYENQIEEIWVEPKVMPVSIQKLNSRKLPIQIEVNGAPAEGHMVGGTSAEPESVQISGPESVIDDISRVVAYVDVSDLEEDTSVNAKVQFYNESGDEVISDSISTDLNNGNAVISITMYKTKSVGFDLNIPGTPAEGYEIKEITFEPDKVMVAGRPDVLQDMNVITLSSESISVEGATGTIERVVDITDDLTTGIQLVNEAEGKILVKIVIDRKGTRTVELPIQSIRVNLPDGFTYSYPSISDLALVLNGEPEALDQLDTNDIEAWIDLSDKTAEGEYEVSVNFYLPTGFTLAEPVKVKIVLTKEEDPDAAQSD